MPTIREVAQKAGVSPAAVSLVLNGKDCRLSESTKRRIFRCARELNYQPGKRHFPPASRSLPVIGILVPDITNLFFADLCRSCQDEARKSGYQVILCSTDAFEESEYASIDTFLKQKLDGIIFIHSSGLSEEKQEKICQRICEAELPLVFIDVPKEYPDLSTVKTDHLHGSYLAVKYLLELGHRRIGCLTGPQNQTRSAQLQGYKKALEEFQIPFSPELIYEGDYTLESGCQCLSSLLGQRITAVFCFNDMMALGVYRSMRNYGLKIPENLSIIGYDNIFISEITDPPLTTVERRPQELGQQAFALLFNALQGKASPKNLTLSPTLKVRGSTARLVP